MFQAGSGGCRRCLWAARGRGWLEGLAEHLGTPLDGLSRAALQLSGRLVWLLQAVFLQCTRLSSLQPPAEAFLK